MVGGLHGTNRIDNTEIFSAGQSKWTTVGPLPQAIAGLAGATLANTVFMTGMSMSMVEIILTQPNYCFRRLQSFTCK